MKSRFFAAVFVLAAILPQYRAFSAGKTLRLDYIFSGTAAEQEISLAGLCSIDGWAGRRNNLDSVPLKGNGQVEVRTKSPGSEVYDKVEYMMSFSTLFQEWQATEEATKVRRSFENVFLVPMPSGKAQVTVSLFDFFGRVSCCFVHEVDPSDILIRPVGNTPPPHEWIWKGGESLDGDVREDERIAIAIVAEGYTASEMDSFMDDARTAMESLFAHEPFGSRKDCFNIVCVQAPSIDSGVSVPREGIWKETAVGSHFDTFYSDRYLTTLNLFRLHDLLAGIPYEHIIILANTDTYGGGGIYNSYTLTTAHHSGFKPVVVHEFGHSFAGLADEYYYDDQFSQYYNPETEPWEKNITTLVGFGSKWQDMVGKTYTVAPADVDWKGKDGKAAREVEIGILEGGGYMSKGVWRGALDCRMKTNSYPAFCPVCRRAIDQMIDFYTR